MTIRRHLPTLGLLLSLPFFWLAIEKYPGGNEWSAHAAGFSFTRNYISALFQPNALNGLPNSARAFASLAMLLFCASLSYLFWAISRRQKITLLGKVIQISGIGSMVYTFLAVVTPIHDLLVLIAAAFYVVAFIGILFMPLVRQRRDLALFGTFCIALLVALGVMRNGHFNVDFAPTTEWALFALSAVWVTAIYYAAPTSN